MNENMVNMAMGRLINGLNTNSNNDTRPMLKDSLLFKAACHILTTLAGHQATECLQRVVCETNMNAQNSSDLTRFLHKTSRLVHVSHALF